MLQRSILTILLFSFALTHAQNMRINLSGEWKFKQGDRLMWAQKELNDEYWDNIYVPAMWERQGYEGYDGFAWYRTEVLLNEKWKDKQVTLSLGKIDDCDQVFFNGVLIGSTGGFPNEFETAWQEERNYVIPSYLIEKGRNIIAVRVYDELGDGGIFEGTPYITAGAEALKPDINLAGPWEFTISRTAYLGPEIYRRKWKTIEVPANWESQGYEGYDGFAYYRTYVTIDRRQQNELWVLLLGKIDDLDEVYINGKLVGALGEMDSDHPHHKGVERDEFRGYYLTQGLLKANQENEILVKVYDAGGEGGIYQGPIGLISQENYIQYWREVSKSNQRND